MADEETAAIPERSSLRRQGLGALLSSQGIGAGAVLERHRTGTTLTWLADNVVMGRPR